MCALFGVLAGLTFVASALASPTLGPAGSAFYAPPSPLPSGSPGSLVWYRPATLGLGSGAPSVNAWDILYRTSDALGNPDVSTGTVIVPTAAWTGSGTRPVIDYAPGTQGLGGSCAPSAQLAAGTEYETANIVALLKQGWAVVLTDYQGYTAGSQTLFGVGAAGGHAVLDAATAADEIPGAGLSPSDRTAIWGYSLGGQTAAWAGQLQRSYDPSMNLVGVAAGGIPGNLLDTANYLNGSVAAGFAAMAILGLSDQYPSAIDLSALENATGAAATATIEGQCVFQTLLGFENANIDQYTASGQTLAQLEAMPAIAAAINAQQVGTTPIPVPMYEYHGQADEIIPLAGELALKQQYCALGVPDEFVLYPSEHIATQFQAAPDVVNWLRDRFAGQLAPPSDCGDTAPRADVHGQSGWRGLRRVAQRLDAERVALATEARRHAQRAAGRHVHRHHRSHHPEAPERHDLGAVVHDDAQGLGDSPHLDGRTHAERPGDRDGVARHERQPAHQRHGAGDAAAEVRSPVRHQRQPRVLRDEHPGELPAQLQRAGVLAR